VTSEQPPHGRRAFSIRSFDPVDNSINTVGELCSMSKDRAIEAAKEAARSERGEMMEVEEEFQPVSVLEQFVADLDKHSSDRSKVTTTDAKRLMTHAQSHHRFM